MLRCLFLLSSDTVLSILFCPLLESLDSVCVKKCENSVLLMNVVNCHVSDDLKAKSVDELVNHTLCVRFGRPCIDRLCPECGVKRFIDKNER